LLRFASCRATSRASRDWMAGIFRGETRGGSQCWVWF
jgi:hypothetical protein